MLLILRQMSNVLTIGLLVVCGGWHHRIIRVVVHTLVADNLF